MTNFDDRDEKRRIAVVDNRPRLYSSDLIDMKLDNPNKTESPKKLEIPSNKSEMSRKLSTSQQNSRSASKPKRLTVRAANDDGKEDNSKKTGWGDIEDDIFMSEFDMNLQQIGANFFDSGNRSSGKKDKNQRKRGMKNMKRPDLKRHIFKNEVKRKDSAPTNSRPSLILFSKKDKSDDPEFYKMQQNKKFSLRRASLPTFTVHKKPDLTTCF